MGAVAGIVVILAALTYWLVAGRDGDEGGGAGTVTVAEFSGTGDDVTDTFDVREGWEIHWENTGRRFAFAITGDRDFGSVIEQEEPGSGVTAPAGAGTFRLEITARGAWTVRIVQPG